QVAALLAAEGATTSVEWGLDHGAWSVLVHLYPGANIPVLQLSIDNRRSGAEHLALGSLLTPLRDEGVLILGSGNIVHNLRHAIRYLADHAAETPDWATDFDARVAVALEAGDLSTLAALPATLLGAQAHPTSDHYLPLLYCAGAAIGDAVSFPITGFDAASLSMRSVRWG
ncbi:MAG: class III extradiol ring-cleavage dioxygenase, partial [bacterium]